MHTRGAVNETNSLDGPALSDAVPYGILRSDESGFYGFAPPASEYLHEFENRIFYLFTYEVRDAKE